ncbi:hypothetical protein [Kribbella sp. CA-293567]|nr:hypothetical protein [Kribbella sp. CA-293567]WBQ03396.1 hypothetical protein OX958_25895 [Kribbella sp. CA-293567]
MSSVQGMVRTYRMDPGGIDRLWLVAYVEACRPRTQACKELSAVLG